MATGWSSGTYVRTTMMGLAASLGWTCALLLGTGWAHAAPPPNPPDPDFAGQAAGRHCVYIGCAPGLECVDWVCVDPSNSPPDPASGAPVRLVGCELEAVEAPAPKDGEQVVREALGLAPPSLPGPVQTWWRLTLEVNPPPPIRSAAGPPLWVGSASPGVAVEGNRYRVLLEHEPAPEDELRLGLQVLGTVGACTQPEVR